MSSAQLTAIPTPHESHPDAARILTLKQNLESPIKGVGAEALMELREKAPEGLSELLSEKLKASPQRFFVPRSALGVPESQIAWDRRLELLRAVAAQRAPEFVPVLVGLVGDRDPIISRAALAGLRGAPGESARNALALLLEHCDWRVRQEAATALADRREPENLALFLRLLGHRDKEIQRQAALGLGYLDCKEAREALAERFRWAVDTPSLLLMRLLNVLVPVLVIGAGLSAHFDPSPRFMLPRLLVVLLAGLFLLARQRKRVERRYLAQSLAAQCKSEVPDEIITLLPEISAVQTGIWQSDSQTIGALSQITRAAKEQIRDRGDLPVSINNAPQGNERNLPVVSAPPSPDS